MKANGLGELTKWLERVKVLNPHTANEWLNARDMDLYVRKSMRYLNDKKVICLDIASVTVFKKGRGIFTELLKHAHRINPWDAIFVECVHNTRLQHFLERYGMHRTNDTSSTPCYYLWRDESLITAKSAEIKL